MKLLLLLILLSPGELKKHIHQFGTRSRDTGSQNLRNAQEYVIKECKSYGLKVKSQGMLIRGKECRNIIAWKEGNDKIVVIGAHLDSARNPGADDNASGSACLLLLAKRFSNHSTKATIVFQWYTGEEQGLLGSKFYAKNPLFPEDNPDINKHIFMLNLDMVGRLKTYPEADDVQDILEELFPKYPFAKDITFREGRRSDHFSFDNVNIPVVWLFTGMHRDYHRSTDTPEKLNYEGMVEICDYVFELVNKVIGDKIPVYILWELKEIK